MPMAKDGPTGAGTTRTFLAIDLEAGARTAVAQWMALLANRLGPTRGKWVKWVDERNLHLTLHFFGGLTAAQISTVCGVLRAAWPVEPFDLHIEGCGVFPPHGAPRVIWAGVSTSDGALARLHAEIDRRLAPLGLGAPGVTRPFSPHLTAGRVRNEVSRSFGRDLRGVLEPSVVGPAASRVDRLTLFESRVSSRGPTYSRLAEFEL